VAEAPADIKELFDRYSENGIMTIDNFHSFITLVQGESKATKEDAEAMMEATLYEHKHLKIFHRKGLNIEAFFRYLFSDLNSPLSFSPQVHHDMNAPLSHYFIYTGHNSYLTGNQLSSKASEIPIIEALQRGVRVIELDMWPNSTKDNIDIVHGGTLTAPVELIKCLKSIKEYAFVASEYPVILTLEDHLTPDLQDKVAKMVTQTFGDILFCYGTECYVDFPSPESLRRKIIISTKPPKEYLQTKSMNDKDNGSQKSKNPSFEQAWGKEVSDLKQDKTKEFDEYEQEDEEDLIPGDQKLVVNSSLEYKHLIAIQARKRTGGIKGWLHVDPTKATRISLREQMLESAANTHGTDIIRFTQKNLLRIFPKGTRFDSSNYNPLIGWMHGAQMVAFNMQGYGRPLWLMQGMFRANGGCGYVKKPDILIKTGPNDEIFDPKKTLPVQKTLKVKIYMGEGWHLDFHRTHFDLYSPPDFYVKVGIAGVGEDSVMKKTKIIEDSWIPAWDEEFEFPLRVPELALLRVEVHEYDMSEKDDFGGQTCLPVSELRAGIRAVPLHSQKGDKYRSVKLLMGFEFV
jgi:phosphatidylinositol phospholipase C delta